MTDDPPASDDPPRLPAPSGARIAPREVWAEVRADYLAGLPSADCCRRHGVGLSALRDRAAREAWRRADQPWVPPRRLDADDEGAALAARVENNLDRVDMPELSWVAHRRMMRAVIAGDAASALRWRRVRDAMEAEAQEDDRWVAEEEAISRQILEHGAMAAPDPDYPDDPDFCFSRRRA